MFLPDKAITHAGKFHADDVFSAAFLKLLNPDIKIERANYVPSDFTGIAFDIGLGVYDHHQSSVERRKNGVPYASFGKLWRDFAPTFYPSYIVEKIDRDLIQELDLADNGKKYNLLSVFISKLNPNWDEIDEDIINEKFDIAVAMAYSLLKMKIKMEEKYEKNESIRPNEIDDVNAVINELFIEPFLAVVTPVKNGLYMKDIKQDMLYEKHKVIVYDKDGNKCSSISNIWDEYGSIITYSSVTQNVKRSFFEPINEIIRNDQRRDLLITLFYELTQNNKEFKLYINKLIQYWIKMEISNAETKITAREMLCEAIRETEDDEIIVLKQFCPWREVLIDSLAKFVIYPSSRGGYNMHTVPKSKKDSSARLNFPYKWCHSLEDAQKDVPDITFCHKGNFLLTCKSIESCYIIAEKSSEEYVNNFFSSEAFSLYNLIKNGIDKSDKVFEYEVGEKIRPYDEDVLSRIIEKLNHVYFRNGKMKWRLNKTIKLLKEEIEEKEFRKKQSMSLDEILKL